MAITQTEIDDALDLFAPLGTIRTRKMMGGLTIFAQDMAFALYDPDSGYYLKVDAINRPDFETERPEPFVVEMKGKTGTMNYYQLPERCYDDPDELEIWGRKALEAALRAKSKKKPKKKKTS